MKTLLLYLIFFSSLIFASYSFYFYDLIHRREMCGMISTSFRVFNTCVSQDWEKLEKLNPLQFLETPIGDYQNDE